MVEEVSKCKSSIVGMGLFAAGILSVYTGHAAISYGIGVLSGAYLVCMVLAVVEGADIFYRRVVQYAKEIEKDEEGEEKQ